MAARHEIQNLVRRGNVFYWRPRIPRSFNRAAGGHLSLSLRQSDHMKASCLIPVFDGAVFSPEWKDALWARFCMGAPRRQRRSVERYKIVKRALRVLSKRYRINQKTVAKWKKRTSVADLPT